MEKIIHKQIVNYLETNNFISEYQSGFREKHCCESLINLVITNWKVAVDKNRVIAIFIDLRKTFETVDPDILLTKLEKYGICGNEHKWFESYLKGRRQRTRVNDCFSESIKVYLGVKQGSILGVLLFLVYINYMGNAVRKCKLVLFGFISISFL